MRAIQMNIFHRGIKKSVNIGQKNKGQSLGGQKKNKKRGSFDQKKGVFFTLKMLFLNPIFTFFQKIELLEGRQPKRTHFPEEFKNRPISTKKK